MMFVRALLIVLLLVTACSQTPPEEPAQQAVTAQEMSDTQEARKRQKAAERKKKDQEDVQQVAKVARVMLANLLRASEEEDLQGYLRDCNQSMRSMYADESIFLKESRNRKEKHGLSGARPIVKAEKREPFYVMTFLVEYSKVPEPVPVVLYLKKEDGEIKVALVQYRFSKVKRSSDTAVKETL